MFVVDKMLPNVFLRDIQVDANHQTSSSYVGDMAIRLGFQFIEFVHEIIANFIGIFNRFI